MLIRGIPLRVFSSVGLERYLDRVEVMGSNPLTPTKIHSFSLYSKFRVGIYIVCFFPSQEPLEASNLTIEF